jgi:hypothetical protein
VPGSREALRQLVDAGHTVAILSNSDGTVEEQLRTLSVCQVGEGDGARVRLIADSAVVGIAKPDPGIFHQVQTLLRRNGTTGGAPVRNQFGARAAASTRTTDPHGLWQARTCTRTRSLSRSPPF